jgi:hypothetical protein
MAEELNSEPGVDGGQSELGSGGSQTTEAEPEQSVDGQSGEETTQQGPPEDVFFDPRDVQDDPKLQAAYKQMQRAYTKKMQSISEQRQKIDAYDAFYQNPIEQVQKIAQQYGYQLSPAQAQEAAKALEADATTQDWQPNNWNDVMQRATEMAEQRIMEKMNPMLSQVQNMRKESIESQLSEIDPTWQQYEDRMKSSLAKHPSLSNDPAMLYRVSVPQEVLESRATQAALRKMETRQQSAQVSGKSTTSKSPTSGLPEGPVSFEEAVNAAKKSLADQGISRG